MIPSIGPYDERSNGVRTSSPDQHVIAPVEIVANNARPHRWHAFSHALRNGALPLAIWSGLCEMASAQSVSMFDPASQPAAGINSLTRFLLVLVLAIGILVELVLVYSIVRFRRGAARTSSEPAQVYGSNPIEIAWTAAPALVTFVLMMVVARTEWQVRAATPEPMPGDRELFVRVVGHQWWWEYVYEHYDGKQLQTIVANEIHVPVGVPDKDGNAPAVHLTLESADVCHSFWVPRLAGKTDLIPGRTNHMWFQCTEPGVYLGQCAEYCGTQHAGMLLRVYVDPPKEFQDWLDRQNAVAVDDPAAQAGREIFLSHACVNCHRIRGTTAQGTFGPDLTHLMSRETLASGVTDNTADNLRIWIRNPQSIKEG